MLFDFLNSIIPSYPISSVPDSLTANDPYLVYTPTFGDWYDENLIISASLYYRTDSETEINNVVRKLSSAIGSGGVMTDGIWIKRGTPFAIAVNSNDEGVKRRNILLEVQFLGDLK